MVEFVGSENDEDFEDLPESEDLQELQAALSELRVVFFRFMYFFLKKLRRSMF